MVVVVIIAATITMALPYITNRNSQTKSFLRKLTVASRELHTKAKLHGAVYRLVIEMPEPGSDPNRPPEQKYWIERSNSKVVLNEQEEEIERERQKETDDKKKKDPNGFEIDQSMTKRLPEIPPGIRFEKVELTRAKEPVTVGKAFIHYLPQGLVDEAAIHIKGDKEQRWTISIHPLTGKAELISKTMSLKDMRDQ